MVKNIYPRIIWAFLILSCIRNWWVKIGFVSSIDIMYFLTSKIQMLILCNMY
jgi:hypothetical protein